MQKIWPKMPNLRWLHSHAAGLEGILFPELVDSSIIFTNGKVSNCQQTSVCCTVAQSQALKGWQEKG